MRIHKVERLKNWQERFHAYGFAVPSDEHVTLWDESCVYEFSKAHLDELWGTAGSVYDRMVHLTDLEVAGKLLADWSFTPNEVKGICCSWHEADSMPTLFTRLDFVLSASGAAHLVGVEAEFPHLLIPSAAMQWDWLVEAAPWASQFNDIHEKLCDAFRAYQWVGRVVHVGYRRGELHEELAAEYIKEVARFVGVNARTAALDSISVDTSRTIYVDDSGARVDILVTVGPFATLGRVPREVVYQDSAICIVEPMWKWLWSDPHWLPCVLERSKDYSWATSIDQPVALRCSVWIVAGAVAGMVVCPKEGLCSPHFFEREQGQPA